MMKFVISLAIFLFAWLPVFFVGLPATFLLLLTSWEGKTTWFGNYLHGRHGNSHMPPNPTLWNEWYFMAIRNPVSNFGKFTLSRSMYDATAWLDVVKIGKFGILYGWKYSDLRLPDGQRPFVFRPVYG